jgi:hypothetical protein
MSRTLKDRENELKLDILESLARSQRAVAAITESLSQVIGDSPETARKLRGHLDVLIRCQMSLASKITGIRIPVLRRGKPGKVWLSKDASHMKKRRPSGHR